MCKPILPMVHDFVSHSFWEAEHIANVHSHNGGDHVHNEITDIATQQDDNGKSQLIKTSDPVSLHIIVKNSYDFNYSIAITNKIPFEFYPFQSPFLDIVSPPPKA